MPPQMPQQPSGPQQPGSGGGPGGPGGPNAPQPGSPQGKSSNSGCGTVFVIVAAVLLVLLLVAALGGGSCSSANVPASTVERTALPAGSVNETGYFTDEDGDWIHDPAKLERGLRHFYEETGVQPYVYILPNGSVRSYQELQSIAQEKYDELFTDQAHFVLVFCDDGDGGFNCGYAVGSQARTVMDDAAVDVLADNLDRCYRNYSLDEEEIFSQAFADTADTIMAKDEAVGNAVISLVTVLVIVLVYVAYRIVRTKRQERERARRLQEEILRTPLEKFGDHEVEELSKKYEQGPAEAPTIAATVPTAAASAYAPPSGLQVGQTGNDPAEGAGRP